MLKDKIKEKDKIITLSIVVVIGIVAFKAMENITYMFDFLGSFLGMVSAFIYGIVIAYILNPIVKAIGKWFKVSRSISILITYALLVGLVIVGGVYLIPDVIDSITEISKNVPRYINDAQIWIQNIFANEGIQEMLLSTGIMDNLKGLINQVGNLALTVMNGFVGSIVSVSSQVIKVILGLLISIYVIMDKDILIKEVKRVSVLIFRRKNAERIFEVVKTFDNMIGVYIGIKAVDSLIIGCLAFILLSIVGSEYTLLLSVIVGFTNMIPYFGPFVGEVIGFLFNVFVAPTKAFMVLGVLLVLQIFDGWYLDPKLVGDKVGVRPFFIILGVVIGGGYFGPIGMLLASAAVATIKIYYNRLLDKNKDILKELR